MFPSRLEPETKLDRQFYFNLSSFTSGKEAFVILKKNKIQVVKAKLSFVDNKIIWRNDMKITPEKRQFFQPYLNILDQNIDDKTINLITNKIGMMIPPFYKDKKKYIQDNIYYYYPVLTRSGNVQNPNILSPLKINQLYMFTDEEIFNLYGIYFKYSSRYDLIIQASLFYNNSGYVNAFVPLTKHKKINTTKPILAIGNLNNNVQYTFETWNEIFDKITKSKEFINIMELLEIIFYYFNFDIYKVLLTSINGLLKYHKGLDRLGYLFEKLFDNRKQIYSGLYMLNLKI